MIWIVQKMMRAVVVTKTRKAAGIFVVGDFGIQMANSSNFNDQGGPPWLPSRKPTGFEWTLRADFQPACHSVQLMNALGA